MRSNQNDATSCGHRFGRGMYFLSHYLSKGMRVLSVDQVGRAMVVLALCLTVVSGCGNGNQTGRMPVFPVKGKIIFQGKPLDEATVNFVAKDGKPVARGTTDDEGNYMLTTYESNDGAAEGEFVVLVTKMESSSPKVETKEYGAATPYPGSKGSSKYIVPKFYTNRETSPLKVTVTQDASKNVFDFEIK